MDISERTAKFVDMTYKNVMEEFAPCTKHLVAAGRQYLKSLQGMVAASRQYTDALTKIASLANNSTFNGCSDIGSSLYNIVDVNKEILAQQSNILKSLEFDFLEPMEIVADKDTKLVGREQKRFQQLYKGRKEAYLKCVSTLKKTRRKKNINTDKQLSNMKMLESAKERLEVFCNDSLKEAIIQERVMYGSVLERQCALNKQLLIYHSKGSEILEEQLPQWESVAQSRDKLPESCYAAVKNGPETMPGTMENFYSLDSMLDDVIRQNSIARSYGKKENFHQSQTLRLRKQEENIYARPIVRAKSECFLPISSPSPKLDTALKRYTRIEDYSSCETSYAKALYTYHPTGDYQLALKEGDIIEFITEENTTGWQFGDNLISGRSGWFPVSYTELVKDPTPYLFENESLEYKSKAPVANKSSSSSVQSKSDEGYEYATLTRSVKKMVSPHLSNPRQEENGTLKSKHYASHPDILRTTSISQSNGKIYHNGQLLPSVKL